MARRAAAGGCEPGIVDPAEPRIQFRDPRGRANGAGVGSPMARQLHRLAEIGHRGVEGRSAAGPGPRPRNRTTAGAGEVGARHPVESQMPWGRRRSHGSQPASCPGSTTGSPFRPRTRSRPLAAAARGPPARPRVLPQVRPPCRRRRDDPDWANRALTARRARGRGLAGRKIEAPHGPALRQSGSWSCE
jgi:hypothetical protein